MNVQKFNYTTSIMTLSSVSNYQTIQLLNRVFEQKRSRRWMRSRWRKRSGWMLHRDKSQALIGNIITFAPLFRAKSFRIKFRCSKWYHRVRPLLLRMSSWKEAAQRSGQQQERCKCSGSTAGIFNFVSLWDNGINQ